MTYLTEVTGDLVTRWECEPPAEHVKFQVLREEWDVSSSERTIYEIRISEAS